ncbi:MAG: peptidoglycan DD-metalloendopeptidase family protein [Bacteroidaceae bacterium]|nr:peptidoglycan DD-metalloendopeptidase family protein [Bacteroidaceae bacterium]
MSRLLSLILLLALSLTLAAQKKDSKQVRGMKQQKSSIQKDMKKNEKQLKANKQEQKARSQEIQRLEGQIQARVKHIHSLEGNIDSVEGYIRLTERRLDTLTRELNAKKERYAKALRYARTQRIELSPTMFVLAGNTPTEMVRRARYAKQYATYQHRLGEAVMEKRAEALTMQHRLLLKKDEMNRMLQDVIKQRKQLNADRQHQQNVLTGLVKVEKDLDSKIKKQRQEMAELDRKIEARIAYEIEQARKKAEAERKRREAEERKRREAEERRRQEEARRTGKKPAPAPSTPAKTTTTADSWLTSEERALSGSFQQNKGRLPVPITGSYMITRGFGKYTPDGMRGVTLDNKGIDYTGQSGARARVVFDGVVSAVVDAGGMKHVLVRHGNYISIYINLSSVIVREGQKLRARDLIGAVARDVHGRYTMQFQLRKERTLLNPTSWIGR